MVNRGVTSPREMERAILLVHARSEARSALAALLALDDRLAQVFASGRETALRQIRLAWWRDALGALDISPPPAEPTLSALAWEVLPRGVSGRALSVMADGWEQLLVHADQAVLARIATDTGATLFDALATVLGGATGHAAVAGQGWALARVVGLTREPATRALATDMANAYLRHALAERWSRPLRPIAMLAALARADLAGSMPGTPTRAAMMMRIRVFGR